MPIYQDEFWGSNAKVCVTYPINANVAIIISDSQQKYVVLKAMRRSGGISKNLLMKNLKSKVYVSFLIGLYIEDFWTCSQLYASFRKATHCFCILHISMFFVHTSLIDNGC